MLWLSGQSTLWGAHDRGVVALWSSVLGVPMTGVLWLCGQSALRGPVSHVRVPGFEAWLCFLFFFPPFLLFYLGMYVFFLNLNLQFFKFLVMLT